MGFECRAERAAGAASRSHDAHRDRCMSLTASLANRKPARVVQATPAALAAQVGDDRQRFDIGVRNGAGPCRTGDVPIAAGQKYARTPNSTERPGSGATSLM